MVSPTVVLFELGPRSLDPAAVFAANAELIRDQTPPDDFCNCNIDVRATKPGLQLLAGTMASTTFLFFRITPLIAEQ